MTSNFSKHFCFTNPSVILWSLDLVQNPHLHECCGIFSWTQAHWQDLFSFQACSDPAALTILCNLFCSCLGKSLTSQRRSCRPVRHLFLLYTCSSSSIIRPAHSALMDSALADVSCAGKALPGTVQKLGMCCALTSVAGLARSFCTGRIYPGVRHPAGFHQGSCSSAWFCWWAGRTDPTWHSGDPPADAKQVGSSPAPPWQLLCRAWIQLMENVLGSGRKGVWHLRGLENRMLFFTGGF